MTLGPTGISGHTGISGTESVAGGSGGIGTPYGEFSAADFGVVGDGATDDTTALQNYINSCTAAGVAVVMQAGRQYLVNSTFVGSLYTPFYGNGSVFLVPNDGQSNPAFTVNPLAVDVTDLDLATVNTWDGLYQGSGIIPQITTGGVCIHMVSTDAVFIGRSSPIGTGVDIGETFIVEDNSNNNPALDTTVPQGFLNGVIRENWGPLLPLTDMSGTQEVIRPQLLIDGLNLKYITGTPSTSTALRGLTCIRSNTYFRNCSVQCVAGYMQQGFATGNCGLVTFEDCWVQGLGVTVTNYGFNFGYAVHHTLINCSTNGCRRGVDGTGANYVKIIGGSYPDGIGAHWGRSYYIYGATVSASNNTNPRCLMYSGSDIIAENCDFYLGYIPSFSAAAGDTMDLLRMREDLPELAGIAAIRGGRIICDNSGALTGRNVPLFNIMNFGAINAQDTGRTVYLPDRIQCKPDQLIQMGAGSTTTINLISIGARLTAADFSQSISTQGTFEIDVGTYDYDTAFIKGDGVTPFTQINIFKSDTSIGPTGKGVIRNCPAVALFCPIVDATAATAVGRWDIYADNVDYLDVNHYNYVLRYVNTNKVPLMLVGSLQDAAFGVTSVGDESWNYDPASVSLAQTAGPGSTQAIGQAFPIAAGTTQFSTVAATMACRLPPSIGYTYYVWNLGANALSVFPWFGAQIDALGANTAYSLAAGTAATFRAVSLTQWYAAVFP